jgi:translation initiation factor 3 subunit B
VLFLGTNITYAGTLSNRTTNVIKWSPRGRHVILASMGSGSKSDLEFWDMDFNVDDFGRKENAAPGTGAERKEEWGAGMQQMAAADHYGVTDIEWDPSGRYVATSVSVWRHSVCFTCFMLTWE